MKRQRLSNIPQHIVKQWPSGLYKDCKTQKLYTLKALQDIYSPKPSKQYTNKEESLTIEEKTEIIHSQRWDLNY